jgi:glycogen phosphorylase
MSTQKSTEPLTETESERSAKLRSQFGSAAIELMGPVNKMYERHLVFDDVIDPQAAGVHDRFVAFARSVRDILSQRWIKTEKTYTRENPKRVHAAMSEVCSRHCATRYWRTGITICTWRI